MFTKQNKFIKKIYNRKIDEDFTVKLIDKIKYYLSLDDIETKITNNSLSVKFQNGEFLVTLESNNISYEIKEESSSTIMHSVKCFTHDNGYIIKTVNQNETVIDLDNKLLVDRVNEETFNIFNKYGIETSQRCCKRLDNYYEDKLTKEKTLCDPSPLNNYTENTYLWRAEDKYVIGRVIRTYHDKIKSACYDINDSDYCFIRYQLLRGNQRKIPWGGNYYGIDSDVFFDYKKGKADIDDVVTNFKSKKYSIPHTTYF